MATTNSRAALEGTSFKPTEGGFVFRAPLPWVFGRPRHYLVDEAQKAAILEIMAPDMPVWRRNLIVAAVALGPVVWVLGVATMLWAVSGSGEPTGVDMLVGGLLGGGGALLGLYFAVAWTAQVQLARMAPIIAQLPPTSERITAADRRRGMTKVMSFRTMLVIILLWGVSALISAFALGMRVMDHSLLSAPGALLLFNLVMPICVIVLYSRMALRKAQQTRSSQGL